MACGNPLPDGRADLLGVLRRGHLARADRPDRLVSDHHPGHLLPRQPGQAAVELTGAVRQVAAGLPDRERLADAQHGGHLVCDDRPRLGVDQGVVLMVVLAPLGVPGQDVAAAELGQHPAADITGVSTVGVWRDVLRAVPQLQLVALDEGLDAAQRGERRQHHDVDRREILVGQPEGELLGQGQGLEMVGVHLPVAGHERLAAGPAHRSSSSAASPGSVFPSRNSRLAPPPVEMWLNAVSGKFSCRTAAAESPPPTTVSPGTWLIASATALVPAAKAGNSKTPTGPFQKTVLASESLRANSSLVRGPISRLSRSAGKSVTGYTSCSASAANRVAPTRSTGSTISTPRAAASSSTPLTLAIWSASVRERPTSWPRAARNV